MVHRRGHGGLRLETPAGEEETWRQYLDWLKRLPSASNPDDLIEQYRAELRAYGVTAFELEQRLAWILSRVNGGPEGWRLMFNKIYTSRCPGFRTEANAFLKHVAGRLRPGRALDVEMGQGRNSVYLATRGWRVTGFDVAEQGLAIAGSNAADAGVGIHALQMSEETFDYRRRYWDLVVITYAAVPLMNILYVKRLLASLRPEGKVLVESFSYDPAVGRTRLGVEIARKELPHTLERGGFRILQYGETEGIPDWSPHKSPIIRLLAEAPGR